MWVVQNSEYSPIHCQSVTATKTLTPVYLRIKLTLFLTGLIYIDVFQILRKLKDPKAVRYHIMDTMMAYSVKIHRFYTVALNIGNLLRLYSKVLSPCYNLL